MGLDVPHWRPIARLAALGAIQGSTVHDWHTGPYAPPRTPVEDRLEQVSDEVGDLCIHILRGVVLGDDLSPVRGRLAPDVVTWTPHLFAVSRDQLLTSIDAAGLVGETLTEATLEVTHMSAVHARIFLEWRLTARFTGPGFINDNLLIEPTGRLLETAGVEVVTFVGDRVVAVHCYYDDLALFEQLVTSR